MRAIIAVVTVFEVLSLGGCASTQQTMQTRTYAYQHLLGGQLRHSKALIQETAAADKLRDYGRGSIKLNAVTASVAAIKTKEINDAFDLDMAETLAKCEAVLSRFEGRADRARQAQLTTALIGTVAGAVIVPSLAAKAAASKSAIAGWGGLAGATNTAQHLIRDVGLDAASLIAARQKVADKLAQAVSDYNAAAANDHEAREKAILNGYSACIAYAVTSSAVEIANPAPAKADGGSSPGGAGPPKDDGGKGEK